MRTWKLFTTLVVLILSATLTTWAGPQDFLLSNRTGVDIHALYVSPSESEEWGDDMMEGAVLQNGGELEIEFAPDEDVELWDLWVEDEEGNALYWREIDLMTAYEIILEPNGVARIKE